MRSIYSNWIMLIKLLQSQDISDSTCVVHTVNDVRVRLSVGDWEQRRTKGFAEDVGDDERVFASFP